MMIFLMLSIAAIISLTIGLEAIIYFQAQKS